MSNTTSGNLRKKHDQENAPHLKGRMTTQKIMLCVLLALIPAFITHIYFYGCAVIWQFAICAITAVVCEIAVAFLRSRSIKNALSDFSYLVTALILAFTLPQLISFYYTVAATVFAIIVVKSVFGGLGQNIFNPAMAGFVFITVSAPAAFTNTFIVPQANAYEVATLERTYDVIFEHKDSKALIDSIDALRQTTLENDDNAKISLSFVDSLSGATYLESIKSARKTSTLENVPAHDFLSGNYKAYVYLAAAYTLGGIFLMALRIILVKMVVVFFISLGAFQYLMHYLCPGNFMGVTDAMLFGGTMLAAFFIITDPVTNAGTARGRIVFSIVVAFLIVFLRAYGSYSDAVAFAVMLGNGLAPLIDVMTRRRPYGVGYKKGGLK